MRVNSNFLVDLRIAIMSAWLGSALLFSATVAPAAFGVLRGAQAALADEWAGAIVSRVLAVVNVSGFVVALLALGLWTMARGRWPKIEVILLTFIALATGAGQFIIGARLQTLRMMAGRPLAELAKTDAVRVEFDRLHGYSVKVLGLAMLAALVVIALGCVRRPAQPHEN